MKPGKLDLPTIWRGCDWGPVTFKWKDANGVALNVSQFRPVAKSLNIDLNPTVTDPAGGVVTLSLTRDETANLRLGTESWDWIWEHNRTPTDYRFPPFLAGQVAIRQPTSKFNGGNGRNPIPPQPAPPSTT
jgi:hypothetical protein